MVRAAGFKPRSPAYATIEPCRHSAGVVHCTYLTQFRTRYNYVSACRDMNKQCTMGRLHLAVFGKNTALGHVLMVSWLLKADTEAAEAMASDNNFYSCWCK